ncbi:MAG: hypothetical protein HY764_00640 [Candidatus Portnoybacteria bacterium]|nr:hypothetical protein [Candidatus Portnoybacteria bacterium]
MDRETKKEFNSLAGMVKRGFDAVDKKFEHIDKKFDNIDKKFEHVDTRFILLGSKLTEHDKRFDILEKKIDQTWGLIDGYVKAQEDFREEFKIMKYKMTQVEKVIKAKLGVEIE